MYIRSVFSLSDVENVFQENGTVQELLQPLRTVPFGVAALHQLDVALQLNGARLRNDVSGGLLRLLHADRNGLLLCGAFVGTCT